MFPTWEKTETLPSRASLLETLSFRGDVGAEVVLLPPLAPCPLVLEGVGVVGVAALLSPLLYLLLGPLEGPGREEPSGSTLSSRSSYGEETFSLDSLRLRVVTLLAKLFFKLRNEILAIFLEAVRDKSLEV